MNMTVIIGMRGPGARAKVVPSSALLGVSAKWHPTTFVRVIDFDLDTASERSGVLEESGKDDETRQSWRLGLSRL